MAIDIRLLFLLGQSNAEGVNDLTDSYPSLNTGDALIFEGSTIKDFTIASIVAKTSVLPSFLKANKELDPDTKYVVVHQAASGSSLIPEPSFLYDDWSPTGTLRGAVKTTYDNFVALHSTVYNITGVDLIWLQGEADAGYMQTSNPGFGSDEYRDALVVLYDYFVANISLSNFYVSELGVNKNGAETYYSAIRLGQANACSISTNMFMASTVAKNFIIWGWMQDFVHYNQVGYNRIGLDVAEFKNSATTQKYRDSIYIETVDISDCAGYWKFNGDGANEVVDGASFVFQGSATVETGTLIDRQLQLDTTDATGFIKLINHPIKHSAFTYSGWVKISSLWAGAINAIWGDITLNSGTGLFTQSNAFRIFHQNPGNVSDASTGNPYSVQGSFAHLVQTYDGVTHKLYLNGLEVLSVDRAHVAPTTEFSMSKAINFGTGYPFVNGLEIVNFRMYTRPVTSLEVSELYAEPTAYNDVNTPITPDSPIITNQDDDLNVFEWTAVGDVELSTDNGGTWTDATSPYSVGQTDIQLGYLQIRVKSVGVNPASAITQSTIAWFASDVINYVTVYLYSKTINGIDTTPVSVALSPKAIQYKSDTAIRLQTRTLFAPNAETGLVEMNLPSTDQMQGDPYYLFDFGGNVRFKAKVTGTGRVSFWDLDLITT